MRKFKLFPLMLLSIIAIGCSSAPPVAPGAEIQPCPKDAVTCQTSHWQWGAWVFAVNEDHTKIEQVPIRDMNLHLNVTMFVEGPPCPNCLKFGKIKAQGDGTFTIDITLRHPFVGQKEYTGFDVRGTVIFPATHYWYRRGNALNEPYEPNNQYYTDIPGTPVFFSHSSAGGAMVLNPTGYSFYLFPGMKCGYDKPINQYYKGKYASETDLLDSTINAFIEFHSQQPRWMFLPWGEVTRTYHIKPPDGAFKFGYIVDASWAPPNVLPVTDPAVDFPDYANAEDPITVEFQQIAPLRNDVVDYDATRWILRHRKGEQISYISIISPYFELVYPPPENPCPPVLTTEFTGLNSGTPIDEYTDETIERVGVQGGFTGNPPGLYLALACAYPWKCDPKPPDYLPESTYYEKSFGYQIVELELVD